MAKKLVLAASTALALHAGIVVGIPGAKHAWGSYKERIERRERQERQNALHGQIQVQRTELIADAREKIRNNTFLLGEFILRANELDAMESGEEMNFEGARERYGRMLEEVRGLLQQGHGIDQAIYRVLGNMAYYGIGDGWMAQGILEDGGSCAQMAQAAASLAYDSGSRQDVRLRAYAPNSNGVGHLAATFLFVEGEYDFMQGYWAQPGGAEVMPEQMPDLYAQRHGIERSDGRFIENAAPIANLGHVPSRQSSFIFPQGTESFEGRVPLFSSHAFNRPRYDGETEENPEANIDTSRFDWFEFNQRSLNGSPSSYGHPEQFSLVAPIERMAEYQITNLFESIERGEQELSNIQAGNVQERVVWIGYLSGLYYTAERELMLRERQVPLEQARNRRDELYQLGGELLENLDDANSIDGFVESVRRIDIVSIRLWDLAFLGERGVDTVARLAESERVPSIMRYECMIALAANPDSIPMADRAISQLDGIQKGYVVMMLAREILNYEHAGGAGNGQRNRVLVNRLADENNGELYLASQAIINTVIRYEPARRFFTMDRMFMVDSRPPEFNEIRRVLGEEIRARGLGTEWEEGIALEFARIGMWPNFTGTIFNCSPNRYLPGVRNADETEAGLRFSREVLEWTESTNSENNRLHRIREISRQLASGNRFDFATIIDAYSMHWEE